jgi:hypothetical protein
MTSQSSRRQALFTGLSLAVARVSFPPVLPEHAKAATVHASAHPMSRICVCLSCGNRIIRLQRNLTSELTDIRI